MEDAEALASIIGILKQFESDAQSRILQTVQTFLGHAVHQPRLSSNIGETAMRTQPESGDFSRDRTISPKAFLMDKRPATDVERVACLAYYLAHYLDVRHFKTVDISGLNTEAAQPKFSNASVAVDNARQAGYLVPATKGNKQISAAGEKFVELLPDREKALEAIRSYRPRRNSKKAKSNEGE